MGGKSLQSPRLLPETLKAGGHKSRGWECSSATGDTSSPLSHALASLKHQSHRGLDFCSTNSQTKLLQQATNEYENFCSETQNQVSLQGFWCLLANIEEETVNQFSYRVTGKAGPARCIRLQVAGSFGSPKAKQTNQGLLLSSVPWQGLKASGLNTSGTAPGQLQLRTHL